ncbi:hypothetical protein CIK05_11785 [Bdellovibrio sp. qaytius]|nr:hypothetical protein CIK05_11785 [Bdellovibrio sp. qaytius]
MDLNKIVLCFGIFLSIQSPTVFASASFTQSSESKLPQWVQAKIDSKVPLENIEKYEFKKATVYLIQTVCCDYGNRELYDEKGKLICELEESFAGLNDSKCPGFVEDGEWIASVYKKPLTGDQAKFHAEMEKEANAAQKVILTEESYGPIKFGSKLSAIEKSIGQKAWLHPYEGYNDKCRYVSFEKYGAVDVKVEKGIVTRVDASRFHWVTTSLGIGAGMRLSDVEAKFPNMKVIPSAQDKKVQYVVFDSKDKKRAIIFTVRKGRFEDVRAGTRPSVDSQNRCKP